ncbi:MAG: shikimate kinase [Oscillospiraceae bacterium]|nr:shikimate kinase [Oscillospiraceae bacterium]
MAAMTRKKKSVYLCGFMGSGKTYAGEMVAKKLNLPFIDLDKYIEQKEKRTIPEIFEESGERYFRELEVAAISRMTDGYIIALGGGAIVSRKNAKMINEFGISIFIDTEFEACYSRIKGDATRPLAYNSPKKKIEKLYNSRKIIYTNNSQHTIDGNTSGELITEQIIAIYNKENKC